MNDGRKEAKKRENERIKEIEKKDNGKDDKWIKRKKEINNGGKRTSEKERKKERQKEGREIILN